MMRIAVRLFRHRLVAIICSRLTMSAAGMLVGIALARALGPAGLGDYAHLIATVAIVGTFLCMGMEIPYNLAATGNPHGGGNLLLLVAGQAAVTLPVAGLIWLVLDCTGNGPGGSPMLFALVAAAVVLNQLTQPVMSGLQKQVWVNIAMAILLLMQGLALMLLSRRGIASMPIAVMIYVLVLGLLGLVALALHWRGREVSFAYAQTVRDLFAQGRHYILATLGGILRLRIGIVLMGWYVPAHDIGNYQIMQTLTEVLYLIPVTVSTYVLSARMEGAALAQEAMRAALASCTITILCVLGVSIALPFAVPLLYGPGFGAAVTYGPLMLSGAVAFAVAKGISSWFSRMGRAALVTRVEVATTVVALAAFVMLVPAEGLRGAVWSFVIASWFGACVYAALLGGGMLRGGARCSKTFGGLAGWRG